MGNHQVHPSREREDTMKGQKNLLYVAVALLMVAGILFAAQWGRNREKPYATSPQDIQQEIERIKNNPNMPEQAKSIAIQQLQMRSGNYGSPSNSPK
jgi:hypothetical protein